MQRREAPAAREPRSSAARGALWNRSGRLLRVTFKLICRRQLLTLSWSPESRISGTFIPLNSSGRV